MGGYVAVTCDAYSIEEIGNHDVGPSEARKLLCRGFHPLIGHSTL
jgi:hypothetical protein